MFRGETIQPPSLQLSVSSLSVSPTELNPSALVPRHSTRETARNSARLKEHLVDAADISVSLHLGHLTDVALAFKEFQQYGVAITSLDRADVYPTSNVLGNLLKHLKNRDIREIAVTVGRRLHNVGTEQHSNTKTDQGINAFKKQAKYDKQNPIILRTHAGLWIDDSGKVGDRLRKRLEGTSVVLAVEIFSFHQTQTEYAELIRRLAAKNTTSTPIYFDLDLGHIAEAAYKHRARSEGLQALAFYEIITRDLGRLVGATSLNTHQKGATVTHQRFLESAPQHYETLRILGKGIKDHDIPPNTLVVVESSPFERSQLMTDYGKNFFRDMTRSFQQGARITA